MLPSPLSQSDTPLLDALRACAENQHAPFYTPGHKRGVGISPRLFDLLGDRVFRADLPELAELDNLFAPEGVIQKAQSLAAEAFGAEQTWFLVNGSTGGIMAAILATCRTHDKIILPRNVHQSVISGLILAGATPIFISPEYDSRLDIAHGITPSSVENALQRHPDAKAVLMVYPTYYGACANIEAIAQIVHQYDVPLLVDEAHGPHFAFHPDLPTPALAAGADLSVQSIHKVLGAFTQASMLHLQGTRIDRDRLRKSLQLVQSTSPSYLLMASLDAARQQMALHGQTLMQRTLNLARQARERIAQIPGLSVLEADQSAGFFALDPTRLTITVSELGISGFEADEILSSQLGVIAEFACLQQVTFIISLGNTQADIDQMVQAFTKLAQMSHQSSRLTESLKMYQRWKAEFLQIHPSSFVLQPALSPRDAFFAPTETVAIEHSLDQVSAEFLCPYPPGIPALMPGEMINASTLDYLKQILAVGGLITGCSDPSLNTLKVVKR